MSSILDALKKLEEDKAQREAQQEDYEAFVPERAEQDLLGGRYRIGRPGRRSRSASVALIGVSLVGGLVLVIIGATIAFTRSASTDNTRLAKSSTDTPPVTRTEQRPGITEGDANAPRTPEPMATADAAAEQDLAPPSATTEPTDDKALTATAVTLPSESKPLPATTAPQAASAPTASPVPPEPIAPSVPPDAPSTAPEPAASEVAVPVPQPVVEEPPMPAAAPPSAPPQTMPTEPAAVNEPASALTDTVSAPQALAANDTTPPEPVPAPVSPPSVAQQPVERAPLETPTRVTARPTSLVEPALEPPVGEFLPAATEVRPPASRPVPEDLRDLPPLRQTERQRYGLEEMKINMLRVPGDNEPLSHAHAYINVNKIYVGERIPGTQATLIGVRSYGIAIEVQQTGERFFVKN